MSQVDLPAQFCNDILTLFGDVDGQHLLDSLSSESCTAIRFNSRKNGSHPDWCNSGTPVSWCANGLTLPQRPAFTFTPQFHAGLFYVQEPASMIHESIVRQIVDHDKPVKLLDLCAAPGGKTTAAINALPNGSLVVANEYDAKRSSILKENLEKWGYPDNIVVNSDTARLCKACGNFDIVIADVPCSGEGMMRKEEMARKQWNHGLIEQCRLLQREILSHADSAVAPGGHLIYSTCTFNREENEDNVKWFCSEYGYESVPIDMACSGGIIGSFDPDVKAMRFSPYHTGSEGLFVSLLRKVSDHPAKQMKYSKLKSSAHIDIPWVDLNGKTFITHGQMISVLSETVAQYYSALSHAGIRILSAGVQCAEMKGKDLIPAHAVALSSILKREAIQTAELTTEQAIAYLRRESINPDTDLDKGYAVVTYGSLPLGWIKNIGNRTNNLYPQAYRIRTNNR